MKKDTSIQNTHSDEEKLKAAYALNMCTVSVSQIVDYNDLYILEQEYDAILNNLNLKQMPKDEALLRIISELLNTITFFKIQEIKKMQIEKKYRQRLNNAIWSAIPSLSVIVSGNPIAIALSLATQIGSGYMNYRREKANIAVDREDSETELQITAIEQLNALRRELFTTAWRLADEYDFNDEWRLTEKQIKQYNEILIDNDEYRKYARLESIANRFEAYPPFWYFYGHTANYIAETARTEMNKNTQTTDKDTNRYCELSYIVESYTNLAKSHYEHYYKLCTNNILREDQLTATFALEYADILLNEKNPDSEKVKDLLNLAEKMTPNSFDILQLCSISYLKIGASDDAIRLLKILVNEDYNAIANAKLLSRLYVSKYITDKDSLALTNYKILEKQIGSLYLYPMPKITADKTKEQNLESEFMINQKAILIKAYRNSINAYARKKIVEFNAVFPAGKKNINNRSLYFDYTDEAKKKRMSDIKNIFDTDSLRCNYVQMLKECGIRYRYIEILNQTVLGLEMLSCFKKLKAHDLLIKIIERRIRLAKRVLSEIQAKIDNGRFAFDDYCKLINEYSYQYFTEDFFDLLKGKLSEYIRQSNDMKELDIYDFELYNFCTKYKLPSPEKYLYTYRKNDQPVTESNEQIFFSGELIGVEGEEIDNNDDAKKLIEIIKNKRDSLICNHENVSIYLAGDSEFEVYFQNDNLRVRSGAIYSYKQKALAIIDDRTKNDFDLILCKDGIVPVAKNIIQYTINYNKIVYSSKVNEQKLTLEYPDEYSNKNVDIAKLIGLLNEIKNFEKQK